jgi:hypothetical protein
MNIKTLTATTVIFTSLIFANISLAKPLSNVSNSSQNKQIVWTNLMRHNSFKPINNSTKSQRVITPKYPATSLSSEGKFLSVSPLQIHSIAKIFYQYTHSNHSHYK